MINKWMTRLLGSSGRKVDQVQILYLSIAYLQLFVLAKVIAPKKNGNSSLPENCAKVAIRLTSPPQWPLPARSFRGLLGEKKHQVP